MHQNIQCIRNKTLDVEIFVETMEKKPDVICFTEHWMNMSEINYLDIKNYNVCSSFVRKNSIHGGTCILVSEEDLDYETFPSW